MGGGVGRWWIRIEGYSLAHFLLHPSPSE